MLRIRVKSIECKTTMSAKGSLKQARDPRFQALFAIRGVSANIFKLSLNDIVGPKGNVEFKNLITVMGCNVGSKFDISKLQFDKIIIASDADVDGLFIRSLLMAFYFKLYPEIIEDGRLFIAEPPLYRVKDKKNPFVINRADYINRYVIAATKDYRMGYEKNDKIDFLSKSEWTDLLSETSTYADDIKQLTEHYKVNDRVLEIVLEEFSIYNIDSYTIKELLNTIKIDHLMDRLVLEYPELYYDKKENVIKGIVDGKFQLLELSEPLLRKSLHLIRLISKWGAKDGTNIVLRSIKTGTEQRLSLLEGLKILKKYQPDIVHRFKGLGENDSDDIKTTIMDPNTRSLIRVQIGDIENDMKIFQVLRGTSPLDAANRRLMMSEYKVDISLIDT